MKGPTDQFWGSSKPQAPSSPEEKTEDLVELDPNTSKYAWFRRKEIKRAREDAEKRLKEEQAKE